MSKVDDELGETVDGIGRTQVMQLRLMLVAIPCVILFWVAGANTVVALMAGFAAALPVFLAWESRRQPRNGAPALKQDAEMSRAMAICMALFLALAVGTQTVIWARGLTGEVADRFAWTAFGVLLLGGMPIVGSVILYQIVQQLRGRRPVESRKIIRSAVLVGSISFFPALLPSYVVPPAFENIALAVAVLVAVVVGVWVYRRLHRLHALQAR